MLIIYIADPSPARSTATEDVSGLRPGRGKIMVWERVGGLGDSPTFDTADVIQSGGERERILFPGDAGYGSPLLIRNLYLPPADGALNAASPTVGKSALDDN